MPPPSVLARVLRPPLDLDLTQWLASVKDMLRHYRISQGDIARVAGCGQSEVSLVLAGRRTADTQAGASVMYAAQQLIALAQALGRHTNHTGRRT